MKWFEVLTGCDGYCTPNRFKTEEAAQAYADEVESEGSDVHVSEGPYEVDTDSVFFWSNYQ